MTPVPLCVVCSLWALAVVVHSTPVEIMPGSPWYDTNDVLIQAHGEGVVVQVPPPSSSSAAATTTTTWYWLGEDKTYGSAFQNINCYSSTDLRRWDFVNHVLTRQSQGDLGPDRVVERPHVAYNNATATWVLWMHVDDSSYSERRAGVATCATVCGNYTYLGSVKPLGTHDSLDCTLWRDDDGEGEGGGAAAYFVSEDRTEARLQVYALSWDYLTIESLVVSLNQYEAPALLKKDGTYFMFGSHLTGWSTNDNQYSTASSISGPWSSWSSFAPSGTNTCNSQVTFILPITGTMSTTYMFLGDRWVSTDLANSRYVWEPLTIQGTTVSMLCYESWTIDTDTGLWADGVLPQYYTLTNSKSGYVADVNGASTSDGANVIQWELDGGANQKWEFTTTQDQNYYSIVNQNSGKCMDVSDASTQAGAKVIQYTCSGASNQMWKMVSAGSNYYQLIASHSGMCLDVSGESTTEGSQLLQQTCSTATSQQWLRKEV
ncbi:family 43 glycosylhydrolase [Pelomyxa schiedti]|nr:family 43 glycosylhydrolase [Pelomyxa schiedti]